MSPPAGLDGVQSCTALRRNQLGATITTCDALGRPAQRQCSRSVQRCGDARYDLVAVVGNCSMVLLVEPRGRASTGKTGTRELDSPTLSMFLARKAARRQ